MNTGNGGWKVDGTATARVGNGGWRLWKDSTVNQKGAVHFQVGWREGDPITLRPVDDGGWLQQS